MFIVDVHCPGGRARLRRANGDIAEVRRIRRFACRHVDGVATSSGYIFRWPVQCEAIARPFAAAAAAAGRTVGRVGCGSPSPRHMPLIGPSRTVHAPSDCPNKWLSSNEQQPSAKRNARRLPGCSAQQVSHLTSPLCIALRCAVSELMRWRPQGWAQQPSGSARVVRNAPPSSTMGPSRAPEPVLPLAPARP